jgi:hypothetical protein
MGLEAKRKAGSEKSPKVVAVFRRDLRPERLGFDSQLRFKPKYQLFECQFAGPGVAGIDLALQSAGLDGL